jgi:hypothetical protein
LEPLPWAIISYFEPVPAESWSRILEGIVEAGILIVEVGSEVGLTWCTMSRGRARVGMGHDSSRAPGTIYFWCKPLHYWSRPLAVRRLVAEVCSIIKASIRPADPQSGAVANPRESE